MNSKYSVNDAVFITKNNPSTYQALFLHTKLLGDLLELFGEYISP